MPFAQLCLTNDGQLQNTDTVNIFSDVDNFTTAFITNLSVSEITGDNCPYIIDNLPEGTTQIDIVDSFIADIKRLIEEKMPDIKTFKDVLKLKKAFRMGK